MSVAYLEELYGSSLKQVIQWKYNKLVSTNCLVKV